MVTQDETPRSLPWHRLAAAARSALGGGRRLEAARRLAGGSKKGVYRLRMDDATTAIAYVWDDSENYWPAAAGDDDLADPFAPGTGPDLFAAAHARLTALGVRVPALRLLDRTGSGLAIVEDLGGRTLEALLADALQTAARAMAGLRDALSAMHAHRAPGYGKVALVDGGGRAHGTSCEQVVLARALQDLAEAAVREPRLAAARTRLTDHLLALAAEVRPRTRHTVVHGELGPDHVLVDETGTPALIDIEGTMYFDREWEHAYLRIRLGDSYGPLSAPGLDAPRLALYTLAHHLSLTAGPLRLLDGGFPHRAMMRAIAEHNLRKALDHEHMTTLH